MKYNLEHFSEVMEQQMSGEAKEILEENNKLYQSLTSDMSRDVSSEAIQNIVREIDAFMHQHAAKKLEGVDYWKAVINSYSADYVQRITDTKYGDNASDYIVLSFQYYLEHELKEK